MFFFFSFSLYSSCLQMLKQNKENPVYSSSLETLRTGSEGEQHRQTSHHFSHHFSLEDKFSQEVLLPESRLPCPRERCSSGFLEPLGLLSLVKANTACPLQRQQPWWNTSTPSAPAWSSWGWWPSGASGMILVKDRTQTSRYSGPGWGRYSPSAEGIRGWLLPSAPQTLQTCLVMLLDNPLLKLSSYGKREQVPRTPTDRSPLSLNLPDTRSSEKTSSGFLSNEWQFSWK